MSTVDKGSNNKKMEVEEGEISIPMSPDDHHHQVNGNRSRKHDKHISRNKEREEEASRLLGYSKDNTKNDYGIKYSEENKKDNNGRHNESRDKHDKHDKKKKHSPEKKKKNKAKKDKKASRSRTRSRSKSKSKHRDRKKKSSSESKKPKKQVKYSPSRTKNRSTSRSLSKHKSSKAEVKKTKKSRSRSPIKKESQTTHKAKSPTEKATKGETRKSPSKEAHAEKPKGKKSEEIPKEKPKTTSNDGKKSDMPKSKDEENEEPIDEEYRKKVENQLSLSFNDQTEEDIDKINEERRRKRNELLNKLKIQRDEAIEPSIVVNLPEKIETENQETNLAAEKPTESEEIEGNTSQTGEKDKEEFVMEPMLSKRSSVDHETNEYMRMIDAMREKVHEEGEQEKNNTKQIPETEEESKENVVKKGNFDMFSDSPIGMEPARISIQNPIRLDEWDDEEKYYRCQIGEILNKQYKMIAKCGKGVFSNVIRAININTNQEVCIKILRSEPVMLRAGEKERSILQQLNQSDPHDKKHIIRLLGSFEHRKHLCLVFESMEMDLRETIKTCGKKIGLSIDWVKLYAKQLFIALAQLKKHKIIHADRILFIHRKILTIIPFFSITLVKPDNILVTNNKKILKLCDFGSAFPVNENSITEYLISRYYRAPEVILGCPYDTAVDVWSAACTIFELYTGVFLFPGSNNNEMLKLIMQTKGRFNNKMLKKGEFTSKHFDPQNNFLSREKDLITQQIYYKPFPISDKPTRDIGGLLSQISVGISNPDKQKVVNNLKDFLEKCLALDPKNRMTPEEALNHPFLHSQSQSNKLTKDLRPILKF